MACRRGILFRRSVRAVAAAAVAAAAACVCRLLGFGWVGIGLEWGWGWVGGVFSCGWGGSQRNGRLILASHWNGKRGSRAGAAVTAAAGPAPAQLPGCAWNQAAHQRHCHDYPQFFR